MILLSIQIFRIIEFLINEWDILSRIHDEFLDG